MSTTIGRRLIANGASPDSQIVYVTRPEPIVPEARAVHDYLADPAVSETDRMRMKQMVMMLLAMARGERGA